jgi:hypothetical protein
MPELAQASTTLQRVVANPPGPSWISTDASVFTAIHSLISAICLATFLTFNLSPHPHHPRDPRLKIHLSQKFSGTSAGISGIG